jgi:hypothetical protein
MEPRGCNWWQSVANQIGAESPKQAKSVAAGCHRLPEKMVRRGSTVRVRQRALQKPRITGFLFRIDLQVLERGAGMEPFMEPSGRKRRPRKPRR